MQKPTLSKTHKIIFGVQVALALVLAVVGLVDAGGADGWADLARVAVSILAIAYLVSIAVAAAAARWLTSQNGGRIALAVAGPPALMVLATLAIRLIP